MFIFLFYFNRILKKKIKNARYRNKKTNKRPAYYFNKNFNKN